MDAVQFNKQLDAELLSTGVVSKELWGQLKEAHGYGAATSVSWVEAKLAVLAKRLETGSQVSLYVPAVSDPQICNSVSELRAWASNQLPGVRVAGTGFAT